jgi:hypothetical protein
MIGYGYMNILRVVAILPLAIACNGSDSVTTFDALIFLSLFIMPGVFIFVAIYVFKKIFGLMGGPPEDQG